MAAPKTKLKTKPARRNRKLKTTPIGDVADRFASREARAAVVDILATALLRLIIEGRCRSGARVN